MAKEVKSRILISWLGYTDLKAMAQGQSKSLQEKIVEIVHDLKPPEGGLGPVKTLLKHAQYDRIYLLSDYADTINNAYLKWLGRRDSNPQPSDRQSDTPFLNPYATTTYMRFFGPKRGLQVNNK